MKKLSLIALLISSLSAWSVPEALYAKLMQEKVLPHFAQLTSHTFINHQGLTLHYRKLLLNPKAPTLVISPGRSEYTWKYAELIYDLRDLNYNIFIIDHQGQGQSARILEDHHKGYVRLFRDYEMDFKQWVHEEILPLVDSDKVYLLAHSMGAAIAVRYEARHPTFKKIILSAPMFKINTEPYSEFVARMYSDLLVRIGKGTNYAPNRGPYVAEKDNFESNDVTHSELRHATNKNFIMRFPELALGGPTSRWVNQTLKATRSIHQLGKKIEKPILLFQAGDDRLVKLSRQGQFCAQSLQCSLVILPDAFHEILMETDYIRNKALHRIRSYLTQD